MFKILKEEEETLKQCIALMLYGDTIPKEEAPHLFTVYQIAKLLSVSTNFVRKTMDLLLKDQGCPDGAIEVKSSVINTKGSDNFTKPEREKFLDNYYTQA